MANKRKLTKENVTDIHNEMVQNKWTLVKAAQLNSVKPGMNYVTLWTNLKAYGLITPAKRGKNNAENADS